MKKNILLIDDSALMRRVLSDIINASKEYQVTYEAANGFEGLNIIDQHDVDMIYLDMHMPKMNGVEFLRVLKENHVRIPVIIFSGYSKRDTKDTIDALALGALDFIRKPENILRDRGDFENMILESLRYATGEKRTENSIPLERKTHTVTEKGNLGQGMLVALACSTGGPKALQELVPMLNSALQAPVVIVQHMPAGFTKSLADRLDALSAIHVKEAEDREILENGTVYIARGGYHLTIAPCKHGHQVVYNTEPPVNGLRPCANYMYQSLESSDYEKIICVVLTGMGADGTKGIQRLNSSKRIHVIAQDAATSTIYGMPRAITEAGMVDEIKPLNEIADAIIKQVGVQ